MPAVILKLPEVKPRDETRPNKCPYCQGDILQRWGKVRKPVRDSHYRSVQVYRYLCCSCKRTFRHYPEGVDRADQTQRLRKLAAIFWGMGLSLRGVEMAFWAFGVKLSHMSVWRDMREQAELVERARRRKRVRVMGIDGVYPLMKGKREGVLVAVDKGDGEVVAVGRVEEDDPEAVREWLEALVKGFGVEVVVSDDLGSFRAVAERIGVEHQVCQFHVRRWVRRALVKLKDKVPKEWEWVLGEVEECVRELPEDGGRRLYELWKQIPEVVVRGQKLSALGQLRALLIRLSEHWRSYRLFKEMEGVPWTNNATERAIGRIQMRSRTVRGYKSWEGMKAAFLIVGCGLGQV